MPLEKSRVLGAWKTIHLVEAGEVLRGPEKHVSGVLHES
jgi:hypothetical protein